MLSDRPTPFLPFFAVLGAVTALAVGTSWAKASLFPLVGAEGTSALRVGFSALMLILLWRPWRWQRSPADLRNILFYGIGLGGMNLFFYLAIQRIPFGIAVAIEFSGPLSIALLGSRRPLDFLWVAFAITGLGLLLPLGHDISHLDPAGVGWALTAATFWAGYILFGKRLGHLHAGHSVSLGLLIGACMIVPVGVAHAGSALLSPYVLAIGLGVAIISSAIPISLEMMALKRIRPQSYGIMISMEPAVTALIALILLDEQLTPIQWLAILLIVTASMGSAASTKPASEPASTSPKR